MRLVSQLADRSAGPSAYGVVRPPPPARGLTVQASGTRWYRATALDGRIAASWGLPPGLSSAINDIMPLCQLKPTDQVAQKVRLTGSQCAQVWPLSPKPASG